MLICDKCNGRVKSLFRINKMNEEKPTFWCLFCIKGKHPEAEIKNTDSLLTVVSKIKELFIKRSNEN